jgi:uncharacterized protein (TIGR03067 family)
MKLHLAIALASCCFLTAEASDDAANKDIEKWQGTWLAVSMETNGKLAPQAELKKIKLTVKGTDYHFQNGDFSERGSYKFDVSKNPKQLDIVVGEGKDKGKIYPVIYKIDGDELVICLDPNNNRRPTELTGIGGSGQVLEVWRRLKSEGGLTGGGDFVLATKSDFAKTTIDLGMAVGDLDRSVRFYTEAIGFKEIAPFSVAGPFGADVGLTDGRPLTIRVLVLGEGDTATRLKLMAFPGAKIKTSDNGHIHSQLGFRYLTIYVADRAAALARLQKAGVKPLAKGTVPIPADIAPGLALSVVRDPDGNLVELISPER